MPSDHERRAREYWWNAPIDCAGWYDREIGLARAFAEVAAEARAEALEDAVKAVYDTAPLTRAKVAVSIRALKQKETK